MSNPTINRWGLNLFWYKYWYTDKNYNLNTQIDTAMMHLVHSFLNFGILSYTNIFINNYWAKFKKNTNYFNEHNTKYFRIMNFKNSISQQIEHFKKRIKIENIYQSKIWILKFQNWIIINFYCFNPLIKKNLNLKITSHKNNLSILLSPTFQHNSNYKRIKFFLLLLLTKTTCKINYYKF